MIIMIMIVIKLADHADPAGGDCSIAVIIIIIIIIIIINIINITRKMCHWVSAADSTRHVAWFDLLSHGWSHNI